MGGRGLILNVIRSHRRSSTYRLSSGVARVKSLGGGANQICTGEGARGKQVVACGASCETVVALKGGEYKPPVRQC